MYYLTKGLFLRSIRKQSYVIEDVFGCATLPFTSSYDLIDDKLQQLANVKKLVPVSESSKFSCLESFSWGELDYYYAVNIESAFKRYLMTQKDVDKYHLSGGLMPMAYLDCGRGDGSKEVLENINNIVKDSIKNGTAPFNENFLNRWLVVNELSRVCSDILSLILRAIYAFIDLLNIQRDCIKQGSIDLEHLGCPEIIHTGKTTYSASTAASIAVISLCTSLDLSSKLIHYIDSISVSEPNFKPSSGKHFGDLKSMKSKNISENDFHSIQKSLNEINGLSALIQFRHDIVHSTSAIELEKLYIGEGTPEINGLPLHYSFQGWRDCQDNGQPIRYLGRSYFTSNNVDIESRIHSWLLSSISAHIDVGKVVHDFFIRNSV